MSNRPTALKTNYVLNFDCSVDREALFIYLFTHNNEIVPSEYGHAFYYFFFELPYHNFNVVAFLLLLNW